MRRQYKADASATGGVADWRRRQVARRAGPVALCGILAAVLMFTAPMGAPASATTANLRPMLGHGAHKGTHGKHGPGGRPVGLATVPTPVPTSLVPTSEPTTRVPPITAPLISARPTSPPSTGAPSTSAPSSTSPAPTTKRWERH